MYEIGADGLLGIVNNAEGTSGVAVSDDMMKLYLNEERWNWDFIASGGRGCHTWNLAARIPVLTKKSLDYSVKVW